MSPFRAKTQWDTFLKIEYVFNCVVSQLVKNMLKIKCMSRTKDFCVRVAVSAVHRRLIWGHISEHISHLELMDEGWDYLFLKHILARHTQIINISQTCLIGYNYEYIYLKETAAWLVARGIYCNCKVLIMVITSTYSLLLNVFEWLILRHIFNYPIKKDLGQLAHSAHHIQPYLPCGLL